MDCEATDSLGIRKNEGSLSERKGKGFEAGQTLSDPPDGTNQEEPVSEGRGRIVEPDEDSSDALESQMQDLSLSLSEGKERAVGFDQESPESARLKEPLLKDKGKGRDAECRIKYEVYNIPDQSSAENFIAHCEALLKGGYTSGDVMVGEL